jgi:mannose-1-phosphate guanylyltransferase
VLPSDHFVEDENRLRNAMVFAERAAAHRPDRVVLLGMVPDRQEGEYGWILPDGPERPDRTTGVGSFVEKPAPTVARRLAQQGGVWNSLILVAALPALIEAYSRAAPDLLAVFAAWNRDSGRGREGLENLYQDLWAVDFSRDILEASESLLRVVTVSGSGWVDVGTPDTLRAFLPEAGGMRDRAQSSLPA